MLLLQALAPAAEIKPHSPLTVSAGPATNCSCLPSLQADAGLRNFTACTPTHAAPGVTVSGDE